GLALQIADAIHNRAGAGHDDASDALLVQVLAVAKFPLVIVFGVTQVHAVIGAVEGVLDAPGDLGEKWVAAIGEDQADGAGFLTAQAAGDGARMITEFGYRPVNPLAQIRADFRMII